MKKNDVTSFFYYMWNDWCEVECEIAFQGSCCGYKHLWNKWCGICEKEIFGAAEKFYAELSEDNRDLLVKRATSVYDRGRKIHG